MVIIVAGSRTFKDYKLLSDTLDNIENITEIVSGCAKGADLLGEQYALERHIPIKKFPAQWDIYGKQAGFIRNMEMCDYADYLIAFWDGKSRGTNQMINYMRRIGKHGKVIEFENSNTLE